MERYKTIHENKVMINPPEDIQELKKKINRLSKQLNKNQHKK